MKLFIFPLVTLNTKLYPAKATFDSCIDLQRLRLVGALEKLFNFILTSFSSVEEKQLKNVRIVKYNINKIIFFNLF